MIHLTSGRVNVMVTNMDRAVDFYVKTLGLELLNRYGDHYAEIQAADLQIGLHFNDEKLPAGKNMSIGFGVTGFDETVSHLKSKGIDLQVQTDGWVRLAHFNDPDGNYLFLAEHKD